MRSVLVKYFALLFVVFPLVALAPTTSAQSPVAAPPPVLQAAGSAIVVPWNWSLVPEGVGFGESFRLLFVTAGERDATAKDIADYNAFVQDEARAGHAAIRPYRAHFRVLGSTETVDARTNTGTHPENDGPGVPIYWLNGPKVADDYADFYDGAWGHADPGRSPDGLSVDFREFDYVYTGTKNDGTAAWPLGGGKPGDRLVTTVARPGAKAVIGSSTGQVIEITAPLYGLSGVFRVESASPIEVGLQGELDRTLTDDDGGRDLFYFTTTAGVQYIIELKNTMVFTPIGPDFIGGDPTFLSGHLVDPSILEVVDSDGVQLLGERDQGGFTANFARAFFIAPTDGVYYVAVGAGAQDRRALGHYTLAVRRDDHADDYCTDASVVLHPGQSLTARIDSDVAPDDAGLNPWDWKPYLTLQGTTVNELMRPRRGIETLDDRDAFRFEIPRAGLYRVTVSDGPADVGVWIVWDRHGNFWSNPLTAPVASYVEAYNPGTYYVEIGTPYTSSGNTGSYTVSLAEEAVD